MRNVLLVGLTLIAGGCAATDAGVLPGTATVDTLEGGAILVRNSEGGVWAADPAARWSLVEDVRIGRLEGDGPDVFGRIGSVIEDPLGRIWVGDSQANEIRVFGRDGRWVRSIGRQGAGPGEFGSLATFHQGPDGNIWVDDAGQRRWEVFDTAGVRVAGHSMNSNLGGGVRRWTRDGALVEVSIVLGSGMDLTQAGSLFSVRQFLQGELGPPDTVHPPPTAPRELVTFQRGERTVRSTGLPLYANPRVILGYDNDFWAADGGAAYAIRRVGFGGDTLLIIERAYEPVPLPAAVRELALEELRPAEGLTSRDNDPDRVPTVYPPFDSFHPATDGSLWVKRTVDENRVALDVFTADGIYLGHVELPPESSTLRITLITEDRIYGVVRDEFDVPAAVSLRIERPRA